MNHFESSDLANLKMFIDTEMEKANFNQLIPGGTAINFVTSCAGHVDGMKKTNKQQLINYMSEPSDTFQRGNGRPFATVDAKFDFLGCTLGPRPL